MATVQFEVVAEAGTCAEAISQARKFVPDLVLMDVRLPDASGIEACRLLRDDFPDMPVVFLSSSPDEADILAAIVAGARGYVLKQSRSAELVRTLEAVGRGESLLDPSITGMLLERVRRIASGADSDVSNELTVREREILPLIAAGQTNKEIAAAVFLSDKTVKNYVSSILAKLGLDRRTQVPAFVAEHETGRPEEVALLPSRRQPRASRRRPEVARPLIEMEARSVLRTVVLGRLPAPEAAEALADGRLDQPTSVGGVRFVPDVAMAYLRRSLARER